MHRHPKYKIDIVGLHPQLRKYLKLYAEPVGSDSGLSKEDATTVVIGMHDEVFKLFMHRTIKCFQILALRDRDVC